MTSKLIERDWRLILESVYRINSTTSVWDMECEALRCLRQMIPSTQGTFFIYDDMAQDGTPNLVDSTAVDGMEAHYLDRFMTGDYEGDRYFKGLMYLRNNPVFRDSDLMPESYRIESKLYKEIYEPQGIYWGLRAYLVYNDRLVGNISIFNAKEEGDFRDKDVELLALLEPHLSLKLWMLQTAEQAETQPGGPNAKLCPLAARYGLTAREMEVLQLILDGAEDRQIAEKLSISFSTFKKHVSNLYRKLGVSNRIQLYNAAKDALE